MGYAVLCARCYKAPRHHHCAGRLLHTSAVACPLRETALQLCMKRPPALWTWTCGYCDHAVLQCLRLWRAYIYGLQVYREAFALLY